MEKRKHYSYLKKTKHQELAGTGSVLELKFLQVREINSNSI